MDNNEERRDQAITPTEEPTPPVIDKNDPKTIEGGRKQSMRLIVWIGAGFYLLYITYSLVQSLISGNVGESTVSFWVVVIACIAFTLTAIWLIYRSVKTGIASFRESVNAMVKAQEEDEDE